jgi:hypothetical protein
LRVVKSFLHVVKTFLHVVKSFLHVVKSFLRVEKSFLCVEKFRFQAQNNLIAQQKLFYNVLKYCGLVNEKWGIGGRMANYII